MSDAHVKMGKRSSDIPVVRIVIMVQTVFTPATVVEITKVIIAMANVFMPIPV